MRSIAATILITAFAIAAWAGESEPSVSVQKADAAPIEVQPGEVKAIEQPAISDWKGYNTYRITVVNTGTAPSDLSFEIIDQPGKSNYWNRHVAMAPLDPGENVIDTDFSGGLYRGEPTSHWRGSIQTPVETDKIARLTFYNGGKSPIRVTKVELVKVKQITTSGGFAFDFGGDVSTVMSQFIGVRPGTLYAADKKFGFVGGPGKTLRKEMTWPTPMLGDGIVFPAGGFQVDLDGGDYIGVVAFERGGYWGPDEGCMYDHAAVKVNGSTVHEHDFTRSGLHFFFENTEITDLADVPDKLIFPANALNRFTFKATKGSNVVTVDVVNPRSWIGLRVAGLILAPDTAAGRDYIESHLAAQRKCIAKTFGAQDHSSRDGRMAPDKPLVYEMLPPGANVYPRDYPGAAANQSPAEIVAVSGQTVCMHLGLYAQKNATLSVTASPSKGSGAALAEARISYGRYLPNRHQIGSMWLQIDHYRPESTFPIGPDLSRSLVVEYPIPADAAAGTYSSTITLNGAGTPVAIPVSIRVVPAKLAGLPIAVGLFINSMLIGPDELDDATYWRLQESIVREQMSAGLNVLTHGPAYAYKDGKISGDATLKYIRLAEKYGPVTAIVNYGALYRTPPAAEAARYVAAIRDFETTNHLPPHYFNCYDEPATKEAIAQVMPALTAIFDAGGRTCGWTSEHWDVPYTADWVKMLEKTTAPAVNLHDPSWFAKISEMGRHPWVYNQGSQRCYSGYYLWRQIKLGAEGRLDWIGFNTQGFAFDNLDGREPASANFAVHSRYGVLSTPNWLSRREGLLDCRIRLALEAVAKPGDPALALWTTEGYRAEVANWTEAKLAECRTGMIKRLAELTAR
jgi:hypothetical protein